MELDVLTAISPIDGRYRGKTKALAAYFSEFALIKYRVQVEVEYFITLCELPLPQLKGIDNSVFETLRNIYRNFSEADAQRIKDIESVTNHDVKAVEYFLKEEFDKMGGMDDYKEFIHFGLTSQDINNTSVPLSIKEALDKVYYPLIEELIAQLKTYATDWADIPMLAKTHGQPASPTRLGKEVMVFVYRLERQLAMLKACPITAKFGGATGNYNAHHVAYPQYDWKQFGNRFVAEKLGLEREEYTTQISNYDNLSAVFDAPIDILMQQGLSYNAAVLLHMIPDLSRAYQSDKFDNEEKIITDENIGKKMVHLFAGKNEECVYAFFLDAKGKEKYSGIISKGDASSAPLFSKDIVSIAARCKAVTVIIAHNHPSGVAFPSRADLEATADIADALDTIGIHLADHIIVADRDYISLSSTPPFSRMFDYDSE